MSLTRAKSEPLTSVTAELNYIAPTKERPRTYTFEPPAGEPRSTVVNEIHTVEIANARPFIESVTLDEEGYGLVRHESAVRDFYDEAEVKRVYYAEAERILKDATGADRVFVFDTTVRKRVAGGEDRRADAPHQPVPRVHVDHTAQSGPQRVRDLLPDEAEKLLRGRVQVINLWRPLRGPLLDAPLAVCDARTVKPAQLVPSDLIYRHRIGETYSVTYDPAHRWYYIPQMLADEVLLLKCFDSETDGRARFLPHTAFTDPTTPPMRRRAKASSSGPWSFTQADLADAARASLPDQSSWPRWRCG